MPTEAALLESPALRAERMGRVDALDKVEALVMLPDGMHLRTEDVARYFEVSTATLKRLTDRHQRELTENGMRTLRGADLRVFHSDMLSLWKGGGPEGYPQAATQLRLYTRRTVLNVAMILRDSDIARCVRTRLLDAEEELRVSYASLDRRVSQVERCLAGVGSALQELGPVLGRMSCRLDVLDRKLDVTHQVVGAVSVRPAEVSQDIARLDACLDDVARRVRGLGRCTSG